MNDQQPQLTPTTADYQALLNENALLKNQYQYDNEWIKFLDKLSENESVEDIVDFIKETDWTDRQRIKIMAYGRILLGRSLSTTYIVNLRDYQRLYDDFALVDCMLPLGMTRFDITPEFNMLVAMIKMQFGLASRMSRGGYFVDQIGKQKIELNHDEVRRDNQGFKQKILSKFQE